MAWVKIKTKDDIKHIINTDTIMNIEYHSDTDLTEIVFTRSAYPSIYVKGDITKEFSRALGNIISLGV